MIDSDDCSFSHSRNRHNRILKVYRRYPLAAALNQVFRPVCNCHVSFCIERGNIAGIEPAVGKLFRSIVLVVFVSDPWALNEQPPHGYPVVRNFLSCIVDDPDLQAWRLDAGSLLYIELLFLCPAAHVRFEPIDAPQRTRLCHSPGMNEVDTEI